jgi:small GTP-binding protein
MPIKRNNKEKSVLLKILVCGDCKVGKTLLCQQLSNHNTNRELNNPFMEKYEPTIGLDMIVIKHKVKNLNAKLHFWDCSGDDRYRGIIRSYYRACCAAIVVIDMYDEEAEESLLDWIKDLKSQTRMDNKKLVISVFANTANGINSKIVKQTDSPKNSNGKNKKNKKNSQTNRIKIICEKEQVMYNEIKLSIDYTVNNEYYVNDENFKTLTTAIENLVNRIHNLYLSNNMNLNSPDNQKVHGISYGFDEDRINKSKSINSIQEINRPLLYSNETEGQQTMQNCCCTVQ